ncbi:MAG: NUDIX hydrolase [Longimicrobiales bacterium]
MSTDDGRAAPGSPHPDHPPRLVDADAADRIGAEKPGQIDSRTIHDGRVVHLSMDTVRFPDGSTGELEMIRHSGAAAIVPVLGEPDDPDPEIVLLRQFRYAAGGEIYEIPAGRPDRPGEPWKDVARRELEEETGWVAGHLRRLNTIYTTPGFTDERIHIFLATDLHQGTTDLDPDEFVEAVTLPLSDVRDAIRHGRIIDAKSVAGLLWFARFGRG